MPFILWQRMRQYNGTRVLARTAFRERWVFQWPTSLSQHFEGSQVHSFVPEYPFSWPSVLYCQILPEASLVPDPAKPARVSAKPGRPSQATRLTASLPPFSGQWGGGAAHRTGKSKERAFRALALSEVPKPPLPRALEALNARSHFGNCFPGRLGVDCRPGRSE